MLLVHSSHWLPLRVYYCTRITILQTERWVKIMMCGKWWVQIVFNPQENCITFDALFFFVLFYCSCQKKPHSTSNIKHSHIQPVFVYFDHDRCIDWDWLFVILLLRLSKKGKTVIFSIHQPRYSIFSQFDHLTLINKGEITYAGAANRAISYFEDLGTDRHTSFKWRSAVIC